METEKAPLAEPKFENRFSVIFPDKFGIAPFSVGRFNLPQYNNGKWDEMRFQFVDLIAPSTSKGLMKIVNLNENYKNVSSVKFEFEIKINMLDPTGLVIESWIIHVDKIESIDFGECNYYNDKIIKPSLVVLPSRCELVDMTLKPSEMSKFENYDQTPEEKLITFIDNSTYQYNDNSTYQYNDQIEIDGLKELLKNPKLLVVNLPIFNYNCESFAIDSDGVDIEVIKTHLNIGSTVFLYALTGSVHDGYKYRITHKPM